MGQKVIDDILPHQPPERRKPKVIEPLPKEPRTSIHELAKAEDSSFEVPTDPETQPGPAEQKVDFQTPEQVAAHETPAAAPVVSHHDKPKRGSSSDIPKRQIGIGKLKISWPLTRKQQIISGVAIVILAFGIGAAWTLTHHKRAAVADKPKNSTTKKTVPPVPIYSTLSGLQITDASLNQKPVTAVMIENSIDARPQSGLGSAGVVFEAVAEGGVTRFLALFQDTTPTNVGPIRSARPYYVQWAMGFDAAYAHVGGSPDALTDISSWGTKDMNQFYNGGFYHRTTDRAAPHNVYTGIDTLNQLESQKGFTSSFTGFTRKKDNPYKAPTQPSDGSKPLTNEPVRTPATSVSMSLSGPTYDPSYVYDAASNSYKRSEAGEAHIDANTNTQISPKVVVAMVVPMARGALDSSGAYYSDYNPIGSGTAYIFQDGTVTTAQWNKPSINGGLTFTDSNGAPLPLNRGQTWITAITADSGVTYK